MSVYAVAIALSLLNRKLGYLISTLSSILFIYYGVTVSGVYGDFFFIAGLVWTLVSIYSLFYDNYGKWLSPLLLTSILGMFAVLTSSNYLVFLTGWEIMTIPAYAVIGINRKSNFSAFVFMAFGELSTILIIAGFSYAYFSTNSLYFANLATPIPLILTTLGFIIKMGMLPFLFTEWLPIAHGSSPANMSAVLSATMTLVAAFGIVKMVLISPEFEVLGYILMGIGGFSVFFGALYAYISDHVKGLVAFSTVENCGAILTGIGVFISIPGSTISRFALDVVITLVLAHSVAKSGLFMVSGSVEGEYLTNLKVSTNSIGKIGGILLASSMSGLLPNIGGVAVWGLLESLFMGAYILHSTISSILIIVGSVIAMGEGFASGALIKFISYTQLFKNQYGRSKKILVFSAVGFLVLLLGSASYLLFSGFTSGVPALGIPYGLLITSKLGPDEAFGGISPLFVLMLIAAFTFITLLVIGKPKVRRSEPWNNGIESKGDYTAFAIASNIRLMLSKILRTQIMDDLLISVDVFWEAILFLARKYVKFSRLVARTYMNSSISWYMIYMIVSFLVVTILVMVK